MAARIAILDDYQDVVRTLDCFALLNRFETQVETHCPQSLDERVAAIQDVDALVLIRERTVINDAFLDRMPNLRVISQTGKLSNHVDIDACKRRGITLLEGVGSPVAPAELCWTLILAAQRHLVPYVTELKQGRWQQSGGLGLGRCLGGKQIGIWGYGKIGKRIARYAEAFDMKVMIWGSTESRTQAVKDGFYAAETAEQFFAESDVISVHLRLNEITRGCITLELLQKMKPDALFVNTSRAELVAPDALLTALKSGRPGYAALDVYEQEPATAENEPLLALPNVLAAPHIGFVEQNGYELYFSSAFQNLVDYFADQKE